MAGFRGDERAAHEARRLGEALARLRRDAGLNQAEAGSRAGMTGQGWGLYESGKRPGLFRPDVQRRLTAALGADPESLALAVGSASDSGGAGDAPAQGVEDDRRDFRAAPAPSAAGRLAHLVLTDDSLDPWAAAGTVVEYDPDRFPRRGQGCVVEGVDGALSIWVFDGADAERLLLRGGAKGLFGVSELDRKLARRVSAVVARRDA